MCVCCFACQFQGLSRWGWYAGVVDGNSQMDSLFFEAGDSWLAHFFGVGVFGCHALLWSQPRTHHLVDIHGQVVSASQVLWQRLAKISTIALAVATYCSCLRCLLLLPSLSIALAIPSIALAISTNSNSNSDSNGRCYQFIPPSTIH